MSEDCAQHAAITCSLDHIYPRQLPLYSCHVLCGNTTPTHLEFKSAELHCLMLGMPRPTRSDSN